jgi:hypothetical protein
MSNAAKNTVLVIVAILVGYFGIGSIVNTFWPKQPKVTTTIKYVPDTLTAKIMGLRVDSLNGIIVAKEVVVGVARKKAAEWRQRALRLDSVVASMQDTTSDSLHTLNAVLAQVVHTDPDSAGISYADTVHVEYDVGRDFWHDISLMLEARKVPYRKEIIETLVETPYIPLWILLPVGGLILLLTGAAIF